MTETKPTNAFDFAFHPLADKFPLLEGDEFYALADSIRDNGLNDPITLFEGKILDGRNRYRGAKEVRYNFSEKDFRQLPEGKNPKAFVILANITRRHLTPEQKRDVVAELIKDDPTLSNRMIAEIAKVSHHTAGDVRTELETTGQIAQLAATTGKDGKTRKVKAKGEKKSKAKSEKDKPPERGMDKYKAFLEGVIDALTTWPRDYEQYSEWNDYTREKLEAVRDHWLDNEDEDEAGDEQQEAA